MLGRTRANASTARDTKAVRKDSFAPNARIECHSDGRANSGGDSPIDPPTTSPLASFDTFPYSETKGGGMGLSDRDYMHERHRQVLNARPRESRPFTPPKETSVLVMVGWWIAIAFILFKAYDWWHQERQQKRSPAAVPTVTRAVPAPSTELPRVRPATSPAAVREKSSTPQQMPYRSGTVYLCRNPDRSTFWTKAPCSTHGAVLERLTQVPEDLPFDAQVRIAEERRRALTPPRIQASETSTSVASPFATVDRKAVCDRLDDRVRELDAIARQPQTASMQDWIRSKRKSVRDAQFRMRC